MKSLIAEESIRSRVGGLAQEIVAAHGHGPLTAVGVLTGALVFLADLIRHFEMPLEVGLVRASSYRGGSMKPGELLTDTALLPDVAGRDVLLVDDILDTGHTLRRLIDEISAIGPASLRTAVLLKKEGRQEVAVEADFVGFTIPDEFVVGYGLDYNGLYRNLPYIGVMGG